jgi:hypothetical protein
MKLSRSGRRNELASGALIYLLRLGRQARSHGRHWIELNMEPATVAAHSSISTRPYGSAVVVPIGE